VAALYTDEDVGSDLVAQLRRLGHTVTRTVDAGQAGAHDADQLAYAVRQGLILVTHNTHHFRSLQQNWLRWQSLGLPSHHGILAVPQPRPSLHGYTAATAALLIDELLTSGQPVANRFRRWHPLHGWTE
jgi:hypothetical protein